MKKVKLYNVHGKPKGKCHPALARKLLTSGKAIKYQLEPVFGIKLLSSKQQKIRNSKSKKAKAA